MYTGMSTRAQMAIAVRAGEKKILQSAIDAFTQKIERYLKLFEQAKEKEEQEQQRDEL